MKKIPLGNKLFFTILGSGINEFSGEKKYFSTSSIKGTKILGYEKNITYQNKPSRANMQPIEGVVCFAKMAQTLKVFKVDDELAKDSILSTGFSLILPNQTLVSSDYLMYYFISSEFNSTKDKLSTGSTQVAINNTNIKKIEIPIFSISTQKRIVAEIEKQFSKLDDGLQSLNRTKENLKKYKASILKSAVEGKLTRNWRESQTNLEPASELLQRILIEKKNKFLEENPKKKYKEPKPIKLEDIPQRELPENWTWSKIEFIEGFIGSGITPRGGKSVYLNKGIKFIRSQNVYFDKIIQKDIAFISEKQNKIMSRSIVKALDVLLNITGASIGRSVVVPVNFGIANVNQHVCIIRTILLNPFYLNIFLASEFGQNLIMKIQKGVTRQGLNYGQIKNFIFPLPPLQEQHKIVEIVEEKLSVIEKLEELVDENIKKATNFKKSILKKAFEGRLVELEPNEDELVEKLLAEIKEEKLKIEQKEKEAKKSKRKKK